MPDYEVTLDGRKFVLTGDHPPTEDEARAAIGGGMKPVPSHEPAPVEGPGIVSQAAGLLPTAGGIAGSMVGGPIGAGIGGAAGEGFKQLAQHATEIPGAIRDVAHNLVAQPSATLQGAAEGAGEGLQNAALQGAGQAGADIGGRVVGKALSAGAGRLYQSALKPTKVLRQEFPGMVQAGLDAAIPVSKGGAEKAAGLVTRSKDAADALVANRQSGVLQRLPGGATIDPGQAVGGIVPAVKEAVAVPAHGQQLKAIGNVAREYIAENPSPIPLTKAQASVRASDSALNNAYRAALDRGDFVESAGNRARMGINDETRNLLRQMVPGLQEQNAKTQAMEGIRQGVAQRTGQLGNNNVVGMHHAISATLGGGAAAFGGRDRGLETFAIAEALTNPAIASRLAIAAGKAGGSGSAQAIRQALIGLMASHEMEP